MPAKKLVAAAAIAVATVAATAHTASAQQIPPYVTVSTTGGTCDSGYFELARVGTVLVCVRQVTPPSVRVTTTGCDPSEYPILVLGRYGVCTS